MIASEILPTATSEKGGQMLQANSPTVLILEDEFIIALDLQSALLDAGFKVAHVTTTCGGALGWLQQHSPDAAVLDIELADGDCAEAAKLLHKRNIPFVVFSVRENEMSSCDPIFHEGKWIAKPSPSVAVVAALAELTGRLS